MLINIHFLVHIGTNINLNRPPPFCLCSSWQYLVVKQIQRTIKDDVKKEPKAPWELRSANLKFWFGYDPQPWWNFVQVFGKCCSSSQPIRFVYLSLLVTVRHWLLESVTKVITGNLKFSSEISGFFFCFLIIKTS